MSSGGRGRGKRRADPEVDPSDEVHRAREDSLHEGGAADEDTEGAEDDRDSLDSEDEKKRWLPSLRWTPSVRVKFLRAVDSVDITKHWRHGSKAAFWYQVLETFWQQQGYEDKFKQPHINSLNMKFFEVYDAYMEGTGEAGPSGSGARTSRSKLGPKDLTKEENEICARIKQTFEPIRGGVGSHKQPRAKLSEVASGHTGPRKRARGSYSTSTSKQTSELMADRDAHQYYHPRRPGHVHEPRGGPDRYSPTRFHRSPSEGYRRGAHEHDLPDDRVDNREYLFLLLESKIHSFVEKLTETIDIENQRHAIEAAIWMESEEYSRRKIALLAEHLEEAAEQRSTLIELIQENRAILDGLRMGQQPGMLPRHM